MRWWTCEEISEMWRCNGKHIFSWAEKNKLINLQNSIGMALTVCMHLLAEDGDDDVFEEGRKCRCWSESPFCQAVKVFLSQVGSDSSPNTLKFQEMIITTCCLRVCKCITEITLHNTKNKLSALHTHTHTHAHVRTHTHNSCSYKWALSLYSFSSLSLLCLLSALLLSTSLQREHDFDMNTHEHSLSQSPQSSWSWSSYFLPLLSLFTSLLCYE